MSAQSLPDPLPAEDHSAAAMALLHLGAGTLRSLIGEHDRGEIRLTERHVVQLAALAHDLHRCAERLATAPGTPGA